MTSNYHTSLNILLYHHFLLEQDAVASICSHISVPQSTYRILVSLLTRLAYWISNLMINIINILDFQCYDQPDLHVSCPTLSLWRGREKFPPPPPNKIKKIFKINHNFLISPHPQLSPLLFHHYHQAFLLNGFPVKSCTVTNSVSRYY